VDINPTELPVEELLPWHRSELERLQVGLDTQGGMNQVAKVGSGEDALGMTTISPN
jgi:hypothetical protein